MDSQIDFTTDINKYSRMFIKDIKINNVDISLDLIEYNNKSVIESLMQWQTCLGMLGKGNLLKSKDFIKIIYCLLTDCCTINTINGNKMDLDIYNPILEKFSRIDVVDDKNRFIKIRLFTVCKELVVIDCKDMKHYKIYELYNLETIKEFYGNSKVNFDDIVKHIKLEPKFVGNFSNLEKDFKKLAVKNFVLDEARLFDNLDKFMSEYSALEKKIQSEYTKLYKSIKSKQ
ncbi:hypothetical protein QKU48_gp1086 [Fadolivirus algeromassiliense]|jgi:hypothetical protein|uniref:Uncharacterized protein n=1 Tax=Fadolivirus FV1/VV64 TaxID=3070911 RepID=A0A7D3QVQ6_9VIRU|nr:hypothetical protein QKU48_gp1086 [Fadolivirus algeromassiliense]QKF94544.1 hypothetical protein Fadolivirus_1_1086 [Fadolivirus FV1/VV64]